MPSDMAPSPGCPMKPKAAGYKIANAGVGIRGFDHSGQYLEHGRDPVTVLFHSSGRS